MSNQLNTFAFEGNTVRVVIRDGEPWWVVSDVCAALGIDKHRDALARLDGDERGSVKVDTLGGSQDAGAISESGLYTLILRSRKPQAKPFRRWVTHEVLPAIRKTGVYAVQPPTPSALFEGESYPERYLQPAGEKLEQARRCAKGAYSLLREEVLPLLQALRSLPVHPVIREQLRQIHAVLVTPPAKPAHPTYSKEEWDAIGMKLHSLEVSAMISRNYVKELRSMLLKKDTEECKPSVSRNPVPRVSPCSATKPAPCVVPRLAPSAR